MKKIWWAVGITFIGITVFAAHIYSTSQPKPTATTAAAIKKSDATPKSLPTMATPRRFIVPSIGISSKIISVGLTKTGDMATPPDNETLGWYKNNAMPGNVGAAVLAAHTGPPDRPSVFANLHNLHKNDTVQVEDTTSTIASFTVTETATYTPESAPRERIFGTTTANQLAIITCIGQWSASSQTYSHRFVIYATRKN